MNAKEYPQYLDLVETLRPVLYNLPGKIVALDGQAGVGKTTLGRYLAWRFNVTLLETDLFLIPNRGRLVYRDDDMARIIDKRLNIPRPIIVDGLAVRRLLKQLGHNPEYVIYVTANDTPESPALVEELASYEAEFSPRERANYLMNLPH